MRWERACTPEEIGQSGNGAESLRAPAGFRWRSCMCPMGAGETTLVRHWIGTQRSEAPPSAHLNACDDGIYHIDLYRFSEPDCCMPAGRLCMRS